MTASCEDRERLSFPAKRRLRRKAEFDAVYARGLRLADGYFSLTVRPNRGDGPRLGLAVATRATGSAVERNRIRRLIRESFRLRQHELPSVDVVVSARGRVRGAPAPELRASLDALWNRVKDRCASLPSS